MKEIVHIVRNVTLFLVMGNILSNLFNGNQYRKYFTFITGVIVVVMVVTPVFSFISNENLLDNYLQKSILSINQNDIKTQIKMAGEETQQRIWNEYEEQIKKTVLNECNMDGKNERVEVQIHRKGEEEGKIKSIVIYVKKTPDGVGRILKNLRVKLDVDEDSIEIREGLY